MTWRSRQGRLALCVTAAVVCAGCSTDSGSNSGATHGAAAEATTITTEPHTTPPATATSRNELPTAATILPAGTVEVSGGALPPGLVDGYRVNGGDLVYPAEWSGRFGNSDLPHLTGPGVTLVEALRRVERGDEGWTRTDEAGWLAMTPTDRDETISELAVAARISGIPQRSDRTDQGADCAIDTYPTDTAGVDWQIQGCSYEQFPRLLALGVIRTGPTHEGPTAIDPTVGALVDALDGAITFAEVRLGEPGSDGSTLRLSTHVTTTADTNTASELAADGPLAGWQSFPGDGSVLLSGPTGATWAISDGVAVFNWGGRW